MSRVDALERAVEQLALDELATFSAWFDAFEARRFDERIERDVAAGRLDRLAEEALADHS